MTVALEELQDLRGVWASLSKIWTQIDDIREKPWLSVQPRKLRYFFCFYYAIQIREVFIIAISLLLQTNVKELNTRWRFVSSILILKRSFYWQFSM